jgi:eukaryotic-like serine/threonine-protein kinase
VPNPADHPGTRAQEVVDLASTLRASPSAPRFVDPAQTDLDDDRFPHRYQRVASLGQGGMGEVILARDVRVGREVALKSVLDRDANNADAVARFLRECRIQGQLEHPSIVPVYDLGRRPDGAPFFTMKRVSGMTLKEVIAGLARGDHDVASRYGRRRLLTTFSSVCLAVDFAHSKGVVHRDLKPSNVMLGDFGEVYVLDWGLARLLHDAPDAAPAPAEGDTTAPGSVLGTPGYMAPEQVFGNSEAVGPAADVYALGAILYELLTLTPLHQGKTQLELIAATKAGANTAESLRRRAADLPAELEAVCIKATKLEPELRFRTAREIQLAVERYLEGERDRARRSELARIHTEAARKAGAEALVNGSSEARKMAMREVGQALALDPENGPALGILVRLLTTPPATVPHEAEVDLTQREEDTLRAIARRGALALGLFLLYAPLLLWMGVRSWAGFCLVFGCIAAVSVLALTVIQRWPRPGPILIGVAVSMAGVGASSLILGPFLLLPGAVAVLTIGNAVVLTGRWRAAAIALGCLALVMPIVLEAVGVLPPSFQFVNGALMILPRMVDLSAGPTFCLLVVSTLITTVIPAFAIAFVRDIVINRRRELAIQAWHLKQLVPEAVAEGGAASA